MRSPDGVLFELASLPPPQPTPPEVTQGRLWVAAEPQGATVHFLNMRADFAQGMELEPGSYQVEVAAAGCTPKREWIELEAGDEKHIRIALTRIEASPTELTKPPPQTEAPPRRNPQQAEA